MANSKMLNCRESKWALSRRHSYIRDIEGPNNISNASGKRLVS